MVGDYLSKLFSVEKKVAVVVGSAGYLCGHMAVGLAKAGARVVLMDKNKEGLKRMEKKIHRLGAEVLSVVADATKKGDHEKALKETLSCFNRVDILINGAGINAPTPVLDITLDEWHAIIDSHVTATLLGCQVFGSHMLKRKRGAIINMSSASAGPPLSKAFSYSVAKAGVKNLTQNLAREWAPFNVRVNALRPGFFPTKWSMKHFIDKPRQDAILSHTAMRRYGRPEELIGAVIWLCSDAASFVTGAEITVDGGFSCMTI